MDAAREGDGVPHASGSWACGDGQRVFDHQEQYLGQLAVHGVSGENLGAVGRRGVHSDATGGRRTHPDCVVCTLRVSSSAGYGCGSCGAFRFQLCWKGGKNWCVVGMSK